MRPDHGGKGVLLGRERPRDARQWLDAAVQLAGAGVGRDDVQRPGERPRPRLRHRRRRRALLLGRQRRRRAGDRPRPELPLVAGPGARECQPLRASADPRPGTPLTQTGLKKRWRLLVFAAGAAVFAVLIWRVGIHHLLDDFRRAGWTLLPILLLWIPVHMCYAG